MKSNLIIFGATGFIGRNLIYELDKKSIKYDLIVRNKTIANVIAPNSNNIYECDISNDSNNNYLNEIFKNNKYEKCIDLAWNCDDEYQTSIKNFDWIQITLKIAKIFSENNGKKFLFAGSVFEYEKTNSKLIENITPLRSNIYYGKTKTACHNILTDYFEKLNIQYKNAKIFNLFGKYEKKHRLIPYIINQAMSNNDIIMNSNVIQDYSYVIDTCNSIYKLLESDITGPVNICSGVKISLYDIAKKICNIINYPISKIHFKQNNILNTITVGSNFRLLNEVQYIYKYSIDDALKEVILNECQQIRN